MGPEAFKEELPDDAGASADGFALVLSGDDLFARGIAVAMHSALTRLSESAAPEVFVLDCGLSPDSRDRLRRVAARSGLVSGLRLVRADMSRFTHLDTGTRLSTATYARLLIPELMPAHIRRVLYLDADVLVRGNLAPLITSELGGAAFGAVRDYLIENTDHRLSGVRDPTTPRPYFNAGILLMDLPAWRRADLSARALDYAAAGVPPAFADQDALNAIAESWQELELRWNVQHANLFSKDPDVASEFTAGLYRRRRRLYEAAAVLHFVRVKPWHPWCESPGAWAWVNTLLRSGWYTPRERWRWLLSYGAARTRYSLGMARMRMTSVRGDFGRPG